MDNRINEGELTKKAKTLVLQGHYEEALETLEELDLHKIKNTSILCLVGEAYMGLERYDEAERVLLRVYEKQPNTRRILDLLTTLYIDKQEYSEAEYYYKEFIGVASRDLHRYILRYRLDKGKGERLSVLIKTLEQLKDYEYIEEWAYELATLYEAAGEKQKCIHECDEIALWFGHGEYVDKAIALKCKLTGQPVPQISTEEQFRKAEEEKARKIREEAEKNVALEDQTANAAEALDNPIDTQMIQDAMEKGTAGAEAEDAQNGSDAAGKTIEFTPLNRQHPEPVPKKFVPESEKIARQDAAAIRDEISSVVRNTFTEEGQPEQAADETAAPEDALIRENLPHPEEQIDRILEEEMPKSETAAAAVEEEIPVIISEPEEEAAQETAESAKPAEQDSFEAAFREASAEIKKSESEENDDENFEADLKKAAEEVSMAEPEETAEEVPEAEPEETAEEAASAEPEEIIEEVSAAEPEEIIEEVSAAEPEEIAEEVSAEEPEEIAEEAVSAEPKEIEEEAVSAEPEEIEEEAVSAEPEEIEEEAVSAEPEETENPEPEKAKPVKDISGEDNFQENDVIEIVADFFTGIKSKFSTGHSSEEKPDKESRWAAWKADIEAEREKRAAEKEAARKAKAERLAAEKAEAERLAAEKAEAERIAAEKAAAEKAEAERIAAEKAEAESPQKRQKPRRQRPSGSRRRRQKPRRRRRKDSRRRRRRPNDLPQRRQKPRRRRRKDSPPRRQKPRRQRRKDLLPRRQKPRRRRRKGKTRRRKGRSREGRGRADRGGEGRSREGGGGKTCC